jgi:hypothetical protein
VEDSHSSRWLSRTALVVTIALVAIAAAIGIALLLYAPPPAGAAELVTELRDRGRIAVIGGGDLARLRAEGVELIAASEIPGLDAALRGTDEARLDAILDERAIAALLVDGRTRAEGEGLAERLRRYEHLEGLRGAALTPAAALYLRRHDRELAVVHGDALARAARQIVAGGPLPRVRAFPEPLRRTRNVEVLVMLRQGDRPRLWRSARGGSIARALITAASVARERWAEREPAMGGSIDQRLPAMAVEVYLLEEDGTLHDRSGAFLERVFTPAHGVAYEDGGSWHYLTPEQTRERGEGSAVRAYRALFEEAGLPASSLETRDVRLYRLVARRVGTSLADTSPANPSPAHPPPAGAGWPAPSGSPEGSLFDLPGLEGL